MAQDMSWIPETLKAVLQRTENHYRSVGFKRTAHLMKQTYEDSLKGNVSPEFYQKYVKLLKEDVRGMFNGFSFEDDIKEQFTASMIQAIDAINTLITGLDAEGKTPTFNGATSRPENIEAISRYFKETGGLYDPVLSTRNSYDALAMADSTYDMVFENVYLPGRDFMVSQFELALGRDRTLELMDSVLSVYGVIPKEKELISDFRYAHDNPGELTEDEKGWILTEKVTVPIKSFARWPILMYYKVPILTAMLPVHNVIFFALVQETIARKRREE